MMRLSPTNGITIHCGPPFEFEFPEFDPRHPDVFEAEMQRRLAALNDRQRAQRAAERAMVPDARRRSVDVGILTDSRPHDDRVLIVDG